jgi:hypothetical protein
MDYLQSSFETRPNSRKRVHQVWADDVCVSALVEQDLGRTIKVEVCFPPFGHIPTTPEVHPYGELFCRVDKRPSYENALTCHLWMSVVLCQNEMQLSRCIKIQMPTLLRSSFSYR